MATRTSFQLPLSGSHNDEVRDDIYRMLFLSTPSLGITVVTGTAPVGSIVRILSTPSLGITIVVDKKHIRGKPPTFNSLSRDHFNC